MKKLLFIAAACMLCGRVDTIDKSTSATAKSALHGAMMYYNGNLITMEGHRLTVLTKIMLFRQFFARNCFNHKSNHC